jgi:S-disulfanyl-L-cysteine oxidoreductase SoxD
MSKENTRVRLFISIAALALVCAERIVELSAQDAAIWSGVYTSAQAEHGKVVYTRHCSRCHGEDLGGRRDYPLSGERFLDHWEAHTLEHLFVLIRDSMPPDGINTVDPGDKRDIVAYLLQQNGFPAGTSELSQDVAKLATLEIERKSGPAAAKTGSLVHVTGCLTLQGERDWVLANASAPEKTALPTAGTPARPQTQQASGTRQVGLLNVFPSPDAHRGHTMHATGFLMKKGDDDAINVVSLEMVSPGCATSSPR